jgi:hypothetical protein
MLNGLDKRFALIGVIIIRSNRWRHSIKTTFWMCCLPFRKADDTASPALSRPCGRQDYSCGLECLVAVKRRSRHRGTCGILDFCNVTVCLIRGIKVMLDRDLAELYDVETKILKRAVRRNIDQFPKKIMRS